MNKTNIPNLPINVDWMYTSTGLQFYPQAPSLETISIKDISISLGNICRYGGHVTKFYSVAEHSCHLFDFALKNISKEIAIYALLHDAAEAYIGDIIRPLKNQTYILNLDGTLSKIKSLEIRILKLIFKKLKLEYQTTEIEHIIKELDTRILLDESEQSLNPRPTNWFVHNNPEYTPLNITLKFWEPKEATRQFNKRLEEIT